MSDPILSLAFSLHSGKGVYSLLLGSGLSRSAVIPTGWEIVLDLIRKLAHVRGQEYGPDPEVWYRETFGDEPEYSRILEAIAKSPAERSLVLRGYFEPSDEERQQGLKQPTVAHRAIASLVADGMIRVILTTNFDRLLEGALQSAGITPTVISTPDAAAGALPVAHSRCTVVKLHGDYLDIRVLNSGSELEKYDPRMDHLLDRVIDEYGLVICGWSAEWDAALRAALERCPNRRFTTFWTVRGVPTDAARRLIQHRGAQLIEITDADAFFQVVAENVRALDELDRQHPQSSRTAVARAKQYLSDERSIIRLHDLVAQETERLREQLSQEAFPVQGVAVTPEDFRSRVQRYEAIVEIVRDLISVGCYWGQPPHEDIWARSVERIATVSVAGGLTIWINLRLYPALLLVYAGGIAAIATGRYRNLHALLLKARSHDGRTEEPCIAHVNTAAVFEDKAGHLLPGMERHHTPASDHLFKVLRQPLKEYVTDDTRYMKCFDRVEYMVALTCADLSEKSGHGIYFPLGCFAWRNARFSGEWTAPREFQVEAEAAGEEWPPTRAGFFDGSMERFKTIKAAVDERIRSMGLR